MGNTLQTLPQIPQRRPEEEEEEENKEPPKQQESSNDENQEEFTCEICIEPTPYSEKVFNNSNGCSHPFCTDCLIKYIRVKLDDDNVGRIKCPALNCDRMLDPRACASLVGPSLFVRWCDVLCEEAIVGLDRCYCPHRNCSVLIVNECGGIVRKSKCPECKRWFCFECKRVWHAGFGCDENGLMRDRNDVAFGRLVERNNWMRCPRCRHFVELVAGCRIVKCRCGISFCYKCGKQVYRHWCHCDSTSRCGRCLTISALFLVILFWLFLLNLLLEGVRLSKWNRTQV